ncbi:hypothetical protein V1514DRAFT_23536 [Lipomyces japonicus]|uniref:uncharacterized protein n=1 Tax=Lipomyces japonicus TaxID=56871 RepID=UPI0034CDDCF9
MTLLVTPLTVTLVVLFVVILLLVAVLRIVQRANKHSHGNTSTSATGHLMDSHMSSTGKAWLLPVSSVGLAQSNGKSVTVNESSYALARHDTSDTSFSTATTLAEDSQSRCLVWARLAHLLLCRGKNLDADDSKKVPEIRITFPDDFSDDEDVPTHQRQRRKSRVVVVQISESGAAFVKDIDDHDNNVYDVSIDKLKPRSQVETMDLEQLSGVQGKR